MTTEKKKKELPEVKRFEKAKKSLERFKEDNPEFFQELHTLADEYNEALAAADKIVRSTGEEHGPFVIMRRTIKYNADKLYDALGRDGFLKVGGTMQTVTKYDIDKAQFEANIKSKAIPEDLAEEVKSLEIAYKKIEKLVV